jgi:hypothetical protein
MVSEIEKNQVQFLKSLHSLQGEISDLFLNISLGIDYDDEATKRLYLTSLEYESNKD